MSREINIGYQFSESGPTTDLELRAPYFLFGTQRSSMEFWNLPRIREIGITHLAQLGVLDPIYFVGWDGMEDLRREIELLQNNLDTIDFQPELKASWLSHLVYCYSLLTLTAPKESIPILTIG